MGSIRQNVMPDAPRLFPAAVGLLLAAPIALWASPAGAVDKASCVAAAEEGQRLRRQGLLIAARNQLELCARPECPEIVSHDCTGWLKEVSGVLASVVVTAHDRDGNAVPDVDLVLDGSATTQRPPTRAIELPPGQHVVRCERRGFVPWEAHVELGEGERDHAIDCELTEVAPGPAIVRRAPSPFTAPLPAPAAPRGEPSSAVPWIVWPLAGLGVAGFGSFAAFGASGTSDQNTLKHTCAPYCSSSQVDPIATKFMVANVSLAVGALAAGAAVLVVLLQPSAPTRH
ncbi:MAG TPA: hypothetical protein VKU41_29120 [Polyangiaceae bacterium]|nr:hypothetical protein [Polyangiaceae bacterium]